MTGFLLVLALTACGRPDAVRPDIGDHYTCAARATPVVGCFVPIPAGTFVMGAQATDPTAPAYDPDAVSTEGPPHAVTVAATWIEREEVTATGFTACLEAGACSPAHLLGGSGSDLGPADAIEQPARGVSWSGADAFCRWIGARLPTEAEWEHAARGSDGRRWPWGDEPGCGPRARDASGRYVDDDHVDCARAGTTRFADHGKEGPFGTRLMAGNVAEWVADRFGPYPSEAVTDPKGSDAGVARVIRGGSFHSASPAQLRSTLREALAPDARRDDVGFRCAIDDPEALPDPRSFASFPELPR